jgi:hypothetical protein
LAGIAWYAQNEGRAEKATHAGHSHPHSGPVMSDALWHMVVEVLRKDLPAQKLEALAQAFGRAGYVHAQQLLAARAQQVREAAEALRARIAREKGAAVLRTLADVLSLAGHGEVAAWTRARVSAGAAVRQQGQQGEDLDDLLDDDEDDLYDDADDGDDLAADAIVPDGAVRDEPLRPDVAPYHPGRGEAPPVATAASPADANSAAEESTPASPSEVERPVTARAGG